MKVWMAGALLALLVASASCKEKGSSGEPAKGTGTPEHNQHGGAKAPDETMTPAPGGPAGLPGYAAVQVDDSRRQLLGIRT